MKKIIAVNLFCVLNICTAQTQIPRQIHSLIPTTEKYHFNLTKTILTNKKFTPTQASGFGGNLKIGKHIYGGDISALPALNVERDPSKGACFYQNINVIVSEAKHSEVIKFPCVDKDPNHNNLYWNANFEEVNNGY